ncbi:MAG TPA: M24 family metallopeptidase, partial [Leucothrix sp.]|nr:M24 family metallopeptidase [Leucothrix sp.]
MQPNIKISRQEYIDRRRKLMDLVGNDSIIIIPSADLKVRNRDAEFAFRQDSDFLYLTGFNEPQSVAVMTPGRKESEYIIFCREKDPKTELWTGRMAGLKGAVDDHAAEDAFPMEDIDEILPRLMENRKKVYYSIGHNPEFDKQVISWVNSLRAKVRNGVQAPYELITLDKHLHEMRLFKSPAEQELMRQAANASVMAHVQAMKACQPELMEYEIDAEYLYAFRKQGMEPAYTSIVGGGENTCILHYIDNNAKLKDGDLLLVDAGAENQGYASDITRTFPVNGMFTEEQRQLYQIVLDAQYAAIRQVQPGNNWDDPHKAAVQVIASGLLELGLVEGDLEEIIKEEEYKPFYMHKTGHWLGLDVHDVGDYKLDGEWRTLEPGMVLTVEPGIYVSPSESVDKKWWNIGIRIEDDVLVTENGNEVLTG